MDSLADYGGMPLDLLANSPFDEVPNTCACADGYTALLSNDYDVAPSMGKKRPVCKPSKLWFRFLFLGARVLAEASVHS